MAFDVATNKLLSDDAAALNTSDAPAFAEQQALAEDLLGLTGLDATLSAAGIAKAERFLALQINYQIETGVDAAVYQARTRGRRSDTYRDSAADLIRPGLLDEVQQLIGDEAGSSGWGDRGYAVITSLR